MSFMDISSNLIKIKMEVIVRFKLLTKKSTHPAIAKVYQGHVMRLSAEGLQLTKPNDLPLFELADEMFSNKILIGMNILLPSEQAPLKILGRLSAIDASDEPKPKYSMGIVFRNIDANVKDKLFKFTIKAQMGK